MSLPITNSVFGGIVIDTTQFLNRGLNLSDISNPALALRNLGLNETTPLTCLQLTTSLINCGQLNCTGAGISSIGSVEIGSPLVTASLIMHTGDFIMGSGNATINNGDVGINNGNLFVSKNLTVNGNLNDVNTITALNLNGNQLTLTDTDSLGAQIILNGNLLIDNLGAIHSPSGGGVVLDLASGIASFSTLYIIDADGTVSSCIDSLRNGKFHNVTIDNGASLYMTDGTGNAAMCIDSGRNATFKSITMPSGSTFSIVGNATIQGTTTCSQLTSTAVSTPALTCTGTISVRDNGLSNASQTSIPYGISQPKNPSWTYMYYPAATTPTIYTQPSGTNWLGYSFLAILPYANVYDLSLNPSNALTGNGSYKNAGSVIPTSQLAFINGTASYCMGAMVSYYANSTVSNLAFTGGAGGQIGGQYAAAMCLKPSAAGKYFVTVSIRGTVSNACNGFQLTYVNSAGTLSSIPLGNEQNFSWSGVLYLYATSSSQSYNILPSASIGIQYTANPATQQATIGTAYSYITFSGYRISQE